MKNLKFLYFAYLILSIFPNKKTQAQCDPIRDSLTLRVFYQSTNGQHWVRDDNWLSLNPISTWYGVIVNDSGCVKCLDFDGHVGCNHYPGVPNNLSGTLPSELKNLQSLEGLYLNKNNVGGIIPKEIAGLSKLRNLDLSKNKFTGTIPFEFGGFESLEHLNLSLNLLSGTLPSSLGNLSSLKSFYCGGNAITGCLDSNLLNLCGASVGLYGALPFSTDFDSFCATSGSIEDQIGAFCWSANPNTINDTINEFCECVGTPIPRCPTDSLILAKLFKSTNGANWSLNKNWLIDGQPIQTWLGVETNPLTECVTRLTLNNNNLVGTLPPEIGNFNELQLLSLTGNNLIGSIPTSIENLDSLIILDLAKNGLSDTLPEAIYSLPKLRLLDLTSNELSGRLSENISNSKSLSLLYLGSNKFSGGLPTSIGKMEKLTVLYLNSNQFLDSIPKELGALSNLRELKLDENMLSGEIPKEFGLLDKMQWLDLSNNNLQGSIPYELQNCDVLSALFLNDNKLTGRLPSWLPIVNISSLKLENNDFSGCFDPSFKMFCGSNIQTKNNPKLPWTGDFGKYCLTDGSVEAQIGSYCYLGNSIFEIQENCECGTSSAVISSSNDFFFNIFPNPTQSTFNFQLKEGKSIYSCKVQIFDMMGCLRFSEYVTIDLNRLFSVDISELNNGFYTVQIITNNGTRRSAKLMVETNK